MIALRKSKDRGHFDHGWLNTYHTFSFAEYHDPAHRGFRTLRVINEDFVAAGKGFGTHPHADMEILTYILSGALQHKDSLGTGSVIRPGEIQRMSAGSGITHSEFNASSTEAVHLLQIWIRPAQNGVAPSYEQKKITFPERGWALLASPDGRDGSVTIGQDVLLWAAKLQPGQETKLPLPKTRFGWLQVAAGELDLAGFEVEAGDGASLESAGAVDLHAKTASEVLFFDLA